MITKLYRSSPNQYQSYSITFFIQLENKLVEYAFSFKYFIYFLENEVGNNKKNLLV